MNKYIPLIASTILLIISFICLINSLTINNMFGQIISSILFVFTGIKLFHLLNKITDNNGNFKASVEYTVETIEKINEISKMNKRELFIRYYSELPEPLRSWAIGNYDLHRNYSSSDEIVNSNYITTLKQAINLGWIWSNLGYRGDTKLWSIICTYSNNENLYDICIKAYNKYMKSQNIIINMDNKQTIQSEIDKLKKQQIEQDKLIKELEQKLNEEDWKEVIENKCEKDNRYYYLESSQYDGLKLDFHINNPNRPSQFKFYKKEHAELMKEKMLLMQEMYACAHVLNSKYSHKPNIELGHFGIHLCSHIDLYKLKDEFRERINKYYFQQY